MEMHMHTVLASGVSYLRYVCAASLISMGLSAPALATTYVQDFSITGPLNFGPGSTFSMSASATFDDVTGAFTYSPTYLVNGVALTGGQHIVDDFSGNMRARSRYFLYPVFGSFDFFIRFLPQLKSDGVFSGVFIYSGSGSNTSETFSFSNVKVSVTELSPVPVTAALPLLASGLGALGFIGWRRKRRAA